jgi:hypothetical protein
LGRLLSAGHGAAARAACGCAAAHAGRVALGEHASDGAVHGVRAGHRLWLELGTRCVSCGPLTSARRLLLLSQPGIPQTGALGRAQCGCCDVHRRGRPPHCMLHLRRRMRHFRQL